MSLVSELVSNFCKLLDLVPFKFLNEAKSKSSICARRKRTQWPLLTGIEQQVSELLIIAKKARRVWSSFSSITAGPTKARPRSVS